MVGGHAATAPEMRAVAHVGPCSGVLVRDDRVLTSAHCLVPPIDHVVLSGRSVQVVECVRHPEFAPGDVLHDIGLCRLSGSFPSSVVGFDDAASLTLSTPVILAGYGLPNAVAHDGGVLRQVETTVTAVRDDVTEVGTADRTACRGDSGGPVFVAGEGGLRVAAIIHGSSGAICASRTEVVPLTAHRDWLSMVLGPPVTTSAPRWLPLTVAAPVVIALALLVATARRRRPDRSRT